MESKDTATNNPVKLQCCMGNTPPLQVIDGWKQFIQFSEVAKNEFWSLLAPVLFEPADSSNKQRIDSFTKKHGLTEDALMSAVQSCGFLLRQASSLDMDASVFRQDLTVLSGGEEKYTEIIISQYDAVKVHLRKLLIQETLADHGKVLVGMDWRIDNVSASNRGTKLDTSVVFLTLKYRENNRIERITLQLTSDAIKELKLFTDRFSG